jgi:hypothetical protein
LLFLDLVAVFIDFYFDDGGVVVFVDDEFHACAGFVGVFEVLAGGLGFFFVGAAAVAFFVAVFFFFFEEVWVFGLEGGDWIVRVDSSEVLAVNHDSSVYVHFNDLSPFLVESQA